MTTRSNVFILSLRQQVIFPAIRTSITIPPQKFSDLCDFCEKHDKTHVGVAALKPTSAGAEEPYHVGTYCRIASHAQSTSKVGDKEVSVVTLSIEGQTRFRVQKFTETAPFHVATIDLLEERDASEASAEVKALMQGVQQKVTELLNEASPPAPQIGRAHV